MSTLVRLNNRIDRWLDRRSLRVPVEGRVVQPGGGGVPGVASAALERAYTQAQKLDRDARLKQLFAPQGTQADGAAARWQFHFELPRARARMLCDWLLDGDAGAGRFGRECLDWRAMPFPPPDSPLAQAVADGRLYYGRLARLWKDERRRTPDLPLVFRDSDAAVAELLARGLGADGFTLSVAAETGGALLWVARTGQRVLRCPFR